MEYSIIWSQILREWDETSDRFYFTRLKDMILASVKTTVLGIIYICFYPLFD